MAKKCIICNSRQTKNTPLSFHRFPTAENRRHAWLKACKMEGKTVSSSAMICSKHFREDDFDSSVKYRRTLLPNTIPSPSNNYFNSGTITCNLQEVRVSQDYEETPLIDVANKTLERPVNVEQVASGPSKEASIISVCRETVNTYAVELKSEPSQGNTTLIECNYTYCMAKTNNEELEYSRNVSKTLDVPKISCYIGDLQPEHFGSPRRAKRNLEYVKNTLGERRKLIKVLEVKQKRLEERIKTINELMMHLKDKKLLCKQTYQNI